MNSILIIRKIDNLSCNFHFLCHCYCLFFTCVFGDPKIDWYIRDVVQIDCHKYLCSFLLGKEWDKWNKVFGSYFSCSECDSVHVSPYNLWKKDVREEQFGMYYIIIKLKSSAQFKKKHIYFLKQIASRVPIIAWDVWHKIVVLVLKHILI